LRLSGDTQPTDKVAIYGRVSGHTQKQDGDLDRQLEALTEYAHNHGWSIENKYSDVGSGLNENRHGLNKLLDDAENADYGRVLVTYQDRLTRFGFSYLERSSTSTASKSRSSMRRQIRAHMKNSLTTFCNSSPVSQANSTGCVPQNENASLKPWKRR